MVADTIYREQTRSCTGCDVDLDYGRCRCDDEARCDDCRAYHRPSEDCVAAARAALPRAGARLDTARAAFNALTSIPGPIDEREFAKRQTHLSAAETAYRALIEIVTGEDASTVTLRLAA